MPIVDLDEQDSTVKQSYKRHSAISQTNEEVEMLKLDPQITNQNYPVPAPHDERVRVWAVMSISGGYLGIQVLETCDL